MKVVNETPKAMYLYNPYLEFSIEIVKPMSRFKRWFWMLLGFEYLEE
jgi:hypothetical protein